MSSLQSQNPCRSFLYLCLLTLLFIFQTTLSEAVYILRYNSTDNGGLVFTGNTLGLSKATNLNEPGVNHSIGAFITTDLSSQVGSYPAGTTLDWQKNSSFAFLDMPPNSTILYAELIWSGSYGFKNEITGNELNASVTLKTPQGATFSISPDPGTSQQAPHPSVPNSGHYMRSADVTSIIQAGGIGMYTVGGVPATINRYENNNNTAGWTLAVAFSNPLMTTSNLSVFVGCEQATSGTALPATVSGFCTPSSGSLAGTLFISAVEGDSSLKGDRMLFGNHLPLNISMNSLQGTNNPIDNFFCSQINTIVNFDLLRIIGSGQLDTRGSFGNFNPDPFTGAIYPGGRQGYDITSVDISPYLIHDQHVAYAKGVTTGDNFAINALGMRIEIGAPRLELNKLVNGLQEVQAGVGDILNISFTLENVGNADAFDVYFLDVLETGLSFVPGTFTYNSINYPLVDPTTGSGFYIGNLPIGASAPISFDVKIDSPPVNLTEFLNAGNLLYQFQPCVGSALSLETKSNEVKILVPYDSPPILSINKKVNSLDSVFTSPGEIVTFEFEITATQSDALNVVFSDVLFAGLTLVPGSTKVNDYLVTPDPNLATGFSIGDILINETTIVQFQAEVSFPNPDIYTYPNLAQTQAQYLRAINDFQPAGPFISNEVYVNLCNRPSTFNGDLFKCRYLNKTRYTLNLTWSPVDSPDLIGYVIYFDEDPFTIVLPPSQTSLKISISSKETASSFKIAAIFQGNLESPTQPLKVNYE